jgi:hypothetical protein
MKLHVIIINLLPYKVLKTLGIMFGLTRSRKSYSQFGEDLVISEFFGQLNLKNPTYLDIGAFHPKWISNTHYFHKIGWSGTVVDIDKLKLFSFKVIRGRRCNTIFRAVSDKDDLLVDSYKYKRILSEIDTISLDEVQQNLKNWGVNYHIKESISTITINSIFQIVGGVDFLNIDIEGMDELVLMNLDFSRFSPKVICFENNSKNKSTVENLLQSVGYELLFRSGKSIGYFKI